MSNDIRISFEFFPTKTDEGKNKLLKVRDALSTFNPEFFSVTYGAGGSTRDNTRSLVTEFAQAGFAVAPHLSFGRDNEETIRQLIASYVDAGVNRIVALRGDPPAGADSHYKVIYASELVAFIRKHFGDSIQIEVAAYPEIHPDAPSYQADINFLKQKLDAGANSAITQYFYNPDAYFYFIDQCQAAGITQPIYPGILPITNYANLVRFSEACGAEIPRWIRQRLDGFGNDNESLQAFGIDLVSELCETLLDNGAPGLHLYTMNHTEPNATILKNIGFSNTKLHSVK